MYLAAILYLAKKTSTTTWWGRVQSAGMTKAFVVNVRENNLPENFGHEIVRMIPKQKSLEI
jgi:hypothetical protein